MLKLNGVRDFFLRLIGIKRIYYNLDDIKTSLYKINEKVNENSNIIKCIVNKDGRLLDNDTVLFTPKMLDDVIRSRLDERLEYYFRWRMPVQLNDTGHTFIHTNDGHRLFVDVKEPFMTLHLLEHGEWESPVRREIKRLLTDGGTFIDVGANIGLHTLYASTIVGESGNIIALEPHPVTRSILRKNVEINGLLDRIVISPFAISNKDNEEVIFEYFSEHPAMSGLKVSENILSKYDGTVERTKVSTITIDTLIEKLSVIPDLIKIDVEGFENIVLEGCLKTIENFPNVKFLIEYEKVMAESVIKVGVGQEIADFFNSRGFNIFRVDADNLSLVSYSDFKNEIRGDYVFSKQNYDD